MRNTLQTDRVRCYFCWRRRVGKYRDSLARVRITEAKDKHQSYKLGLLFIWWPEPFGTDVCSQDTPSGEDGVCARAAVPARSALSACGEWPPGWTRGTVQILQTISNYPISGHCDHNSCFIFGKPLVRNLIRKPDIVTSRWRPLAAKELPWYYVEACVTCFPIPTHS
jgi:hypothetical protein